jgi:hypothetical protein
MDAMINRLPKEFQVPPANGKRRSGAVAAAANLKQKLVTNAAHCIGSYPLAALGAAFLTGLIVGRLVKR